MILAKHRKLKIPKVTRGIFLGILAQKKCFGLGRRKKQTGLINQSVTNFFRRSCFIPRRVASPKAVLSSAFTTTAKMKK